MSNVESARQLAVAILSQLGDSQEPLSEARFVQNGYVIGRRFWCGNGTIEWFFESDEMKVYDPTGKFLKVVGVGSMGSQAA